MLITYLKFIKKIIVIKNCESECELKGVKNSKLFYECKKCRKVQFKQMNELRSFQTHMNFVMETLTSLFWC